jgi:hypothetical protein
MIQQHSRRGFAFVISLTPSAGLARRGDDRFYHGALETRPVRMLWSSFVVASAGATHPLPSWLDALMLGGRLLFPMIATEGVGMMLLVTREAEDAFAAAFLAGLSY